MTFIRAAAASAAAALFVTVAVGGAARDEKLALVTVAADHAKPANTLAPADFRITDGDERVEVIEAVPARDPLSIVLLVDTALPQDGSALTPEMRRALKTFVAAIQAGDPSAQIALYQVSNAARPVSDFTASKANLDAGIDLISTGTETGSKMLEGVRTAARLLSARPAPRRAIVAVAIGTQEGTSLNPKLVSEDVRKSGATLWVVSVQNSRDPSLTNRDTVWTRATEDTGGLRHNVVQATRLDVPLQAVANSLLSQYFLKMVRSGSGAVRGFKGTAGGSPVLFTRWTR